MSKTIAEVVEEYNNRKNPKYEYIGVSDCNGRFERHGAPSNIKEHFENDGWLEFDTVCDCTDTCPNSTITTRHIKKHLASIVEFTEITNERKRGEQI